jgi:hypothetical protein
VWNVVHFLLILVWAIDMIGQWDVNRDETSAWEEFVWMGLLSCHATIIMKIMPGQQLVPGEGWEPGAELHSPWACLHKPVFSQVSDSWVSPCKISRASQLPLDTLLCLYPTRVRLCFYFHEVQDILKFLSRLSWFMFNVETCSLQNIWGFSIYLSVVNFKFDFDIDFKYSKLVFCVMKYSLNVLRYVIWPRMWSNLMNVPYEFQKNVFLKLLEVFYKCQLHHINW